MRSLPIIFVLFFIILPAKAQIVFQKNYGGALYEISYSVQPTFDGGYVIAGSTNSFSAGGFDVYLVKTDSAGILQWTKTFGGTGNESNGVLTQPFFVQQTTDSGYVISAYTDSFGAGSYDILVLRTDSTGNLIWSKTYGGSLYDYSSVVRQTTDGGFIISGFTQNFGSASDWFAYLIKTDTAGTVTWTKTYGGIWGNTMSFDARQTIDGGYILTGAQDVDSTGFRDVTLIKTDSAGNLLWNKTYGGVFSEEGHSVIQLPDGGFVISGMTNSFGSGGWDAYLLKTDSLGNLIWSKTFGGALYDYGFIVQQVQSGGYMIAGNTRSYGAGLEDFYLIKTDTSGNLLWSRTYGSNTTDFGISGSTTHDGGYVLTGIGMTFYPEIYLVKTDSSGHSPCHENTVATATSNPLTATSSPLLLIYSGVVVNNQVTINGNGGSETVFCPTSVEENNAENTFTCYPVPTTGELTIESRTEEKKDIEIYDSCGKKVVSIKKLSGRQQTINVSYLKSGIYFLKVIDGNNCFNKKIIIEHHSD